jgi:hypothetical protein
MRTDLTFGALMHVKNRYHLCRLASNATRLLLMPNTRIQDTTNDELILLRHEGPPQVQFPNMMMDTSIETLEKSSGHLSQPGVL